MLCLPGFTPVAKDDHATGEIGGHVVVSREKVAFLRRAAKVGNSPRSIMRVATPGSRPSSPMITTRLAWGLPLLLRRNNNAAIARSGKVKRDKNASRIATR